MNPRPVVNWNIVGGCNYRCSYCVQKHADGVGGPDDAALERGLDVLCALPGVWEFKLSGGEPFLLKRLPDVATRLVAAGHKVSLLTNLSVSLPVIERFVAAAGDGLRTFSCSLHLEETSAETFLTKAAAVKQVLSAMPKSSFVVNHVVQPGRIGEAAELRRAFEASGLKFYPQLMRINGSPANYGLIDRWKLDRAFADLVGPAGMNRGYSHQGKFCHAGFRYFILHPKGDAYACYPAKRHGENYLGNIYTNTFRLNDGPLACPYAVCPCTVPQNRGMVAD
ncbi:MAG: radical SAM protein [Rhodoferax sp.]|uniref:radical SAM protein n=1 Tax=Rhodoferax sp. TaxID=50421 RepID=UPI001B795DAB|nr:radical SAM protein [Rhodoferax sp.]MBP9907494.1 radical SAM protein [Rhodoferax sp.]